MTNNNKSTFLNQRTLAVKSAEAYERIITEDASDMAECISDVMRTSGLDENAARIVSAAYRTKVLPNIARAEGLDEQRIASIMEMPTANFAKDKNKDKENSNKFDELPEEETLEDEIEEHGHIPTSEEEEMENETPEDHMPVVEEAIEEADELEPDTDFDPDNAELDGDAIDLSEDKDNLAVIQIEIPSEKLEAVEKAIEQVLNEGFDPTENFDSQDELSDEATSPEDEGIDLSDNLDNDFTDEKDADMSHFANNNKVTKMTKTVQELNERSALRKQLLAQANGNRTVVANDEKPKDIGLGKDTSFGGKPFQYNGNAQYIGEESGASMALDNSEGNSLKKDNPSFTKQQVPTMNPDHIQLKDSLETSRKEGSPNGSLQYSVDFAKLNNIPSANPDRDYPFAVPTQMQETKQRKTTVAEYQEALAKLANAEVDINIDAKEEDDTHNKQVNGDGFTREPHKDDTSDRRALALHKARVSLAYDLAYQLVMGGAIEKDEVSKQVEMWLTDNVSPRSMEAQANTMLRCAMSAQERVAFAAGEKMLRQSSTIGISTNPALFSTTSDRSAPQDLKEALGTLWPSNS